MSFPPPHDRHHRMAAPFTALERCVVPLPSSPASGCGWKDGHPTNGRPYTYFPIVWMLCSTLIKRSRAVREISAALEAVKRSGWLDSGWQGPYQRGPRRAGGKVKYRGQGATPRGCDISAPLLSAVLSTGGQGARLPPCPSSGCGWTDGHPTITGGPCTYLPLFWMLCSTLIKRSSAVQGRTSWSLT